eukprot:gb/GECH01008975.1/.p1 GENE.gb/GECH01008975.1/~~gb/GECH01008975.1/.p1  ORF type:complete len:370 (+),score=45.18 gb/GECH01008975.1/:1-1110(+)
MRIIHRNKYCSLIAKPQPNSCRPNFFKTQLVLMNYSSTTWSCKQRICNNQISSKKFSNKAQIPITTLSVNNVSFKRNFSTSTTVISLLIAVPVTFYVLKAAILVIFQNKAIYLPYLPPGSRGVPHATPEREAIPFEQHWLNTPDSETLNTWFIPSKTGESNQVPTVIYFHGNGGNMGHRLDTLKLWHKRIPCNLFVVSYRGYGMSSGRASEKGIQIDAETVMEFIKSKNNINHEKIFIFGHSIGGSVAAYLANKNPENVKGLILENSFTSIFEMLESLYGNSPYVYLKPFLRNKWPTNEYVRHISSHIPCLILSGINDEVVPPHMSHSLFHIAKSHPSSRFVELPGKHNDTWQSLQYYQEIRDFVQSSI